MSDELKAPTVGVEPQLFTGIEALDRMLGGIPNGSVVVLYGKPGSGFDIFAQQILYTKAGMGEAKSTYFTVEHPPEDIASEMASRRWDVNTLIEDGRWEFIDAYTLRTNIRKGVAGEKVLLDILTFYRSAVSRGVWSALDTISYYFLNYDEKDVMGHIDDIISQAREHVGLHFLLLVEGLHDSKTVTSLAYISDGLLTFGLNPDQSEAAGILRIEKLRKADYVTRLIPYRITDTGLVIETAVRMT